MLSPPLCAHTGVGGGPPPLHQHSAYIGNDIIYREETLSEENGKGKGKAKGTLNPIKGKADGPEHSRSIAIRRV